MGSRNPLPIAIAPQGVWWGTSKLRQCVVVPHESKAAGACKVRWMCCGLGPRALGAAQFGTSVWLLRVFLFPSRENSGCTEGPSETADVFVCSCQCPPRHLVMVALAWNMQPDLSPETVSECLAPLQYRAHLVR